MTLETMLNAYETKSAANAYIIGYTLQDGLYMNMLNVLPASLLNVETASQKSGGGKSLRLRIRKANKLELMATAIKIGKAEDLKQEKYNKGEIFEKLVTEYFGQEWKKDNVPFWEAGDIRVNGMEIQIKLDSATITTSSQLTRLGLL